MFATISDKRIFHGDSLKSVNLLLLVNLAILFWQEKEMSLKQLWKLPDAQFKVGQKALTDFVELSVSFSDEYKTTHGAALRSRHPDPMTTDVA